jgi:hypothetical protein
MLISDIRDEIITEVGGDVTDSDLQAKTLGFIKAALRRFPRFTRNRMVRSQKTATLSAGGQSVAVPSGVVDILQAFYVTDGRREEITRPKLARFNEEYRTNVYGHPNYLIVRGSTVEFDRLADKDYAITFECNIEIDAVAAADTWGFSSDRAEIMKDGAKAYYYGYVEDEAKESKSFSLFKAGLDALEREYSREETADHVEEA